MRNTILISTFLVILSYNTLNAQNGTNFEEINPFWINGGIGSIWNSQLDVDAYNLSVNYLHNTGLYSLRLITGKENTNFTIPNSPTFFSDHNFEEISILYGKMLQLKSFYAGISTGLGFAFYKKKKPYSDSTEEKWFLVPINAQFFLAPTPFFGLGLDLNINLSLNKTYYSGFINLQIGMLR